MSYSYETESEASAKASAMLNSLPADVRKEFEKDVWSNLGWHVTLRSRDLSIGIHDGHASGYLCFVNPDRTSCSSQPVWVGDVMRGDTPYEALQAAMKQLHERAEHIKNYTHEVATKLNIWLEDAK